MFFWDQYWPDVLQHFPIFVALNDSTMKRFVLSICLLFTIACLYSQEHLEFRNIPIDGPLKTFVKKLKKQGYKQISNNGTYRTLRVNLRLVMLRFQSIVQTKQKRYGKFLLFMEFMTLGTK